jgi:hypothetical protein
VRWGVSITEQFGRTEIIEVKGKGKKGDALHGDFGEHDTPQHTSVRDESGVVVSAAQCTRAVQCQRRSVQTRSLNEASIPAAIHSLLPQDEKHIRLLCARTRSAVTLDQTPTTAHWIKTKVATTHCHCLFLPANISPPNRTASDRPLSPLPSKQCMNRVRCDITRHPEHGPIYLWTRAGNFHRCAPSPPIIW